MPHARCCSTTTSLALHSRCCCCCILIACLPACLLHLSGQQLLTVSGVSQGLMYATCLLPSDNHKHSPCIPAAAAAVFTCLPFSTVRPAACSLYLASTKASCTPHAHCSPTTILLTLHPRRCCCCSCCCCCVPVSAFCSGQQLLTVSGVSQGLMYATCSLLSNNHKHSLCSPAAAAAVSTCLPFSNRQASSCSLYLASPKI
jgi:hypothetical protein